MIKVYGIHGSPFARKVFIMLDMKGIEYQIIPQMPFAADETYRKINPLGKIPALVDGELTLNDSKVICRYLEHAYPETPLYPRGVAERAMTDWYEELGGGRVTELAAGIFFHRILQPMMFKKEPDEQRVSTIIKEQLPPLLDYLETQIPKDAFIFDTFSMADLSIVSPFINAEYARYSVDPAAQPALAGLIARVKALPCVKTILDKEAKLLGIPRA